MKRFEVLLASGDIDVFPPNAEFTAREDGSLLLDSGGTDHTLLALYAPGMWMRISIEEVTDAGS